MSAAGVQHRGSPPRRSGVRLWGLRLLGLLGTAAVLGVGAAAMLAVLPDRSATDDAGLVGSAPAATPATHKAAAAHHAKLTAAQRRARAAAVATLRAEGYRPVALGDYQPRSVLRVLIGRGEAGERAFFFAGRRYLGHDAADDSEQLTVARAGNRSVAVTYRLYGARPHRARVLFRWDGAKLAPMTAIPLAARRRAPAA